MKVRIKDDIDVWPLPPQNTQAPLHASGRGPLELSRWSSDQCDFGVIFSDTAREANYTIHIQDGPHY